MDRFFAGWRAAVDWLLSALALACGALCLVGAAQILAVRGPLWMSTLSAAFGIAVILGVVVWRRRPR